MNDADRLFRGAIDGVALHAFLADAGGLILSLRHSMPCKSLAGRPKGTDVACAAQSDRVSGGFLHGQGDEPDHRAGLSGARLALRKGLTRDAGR
ncbi:hypothetical protein AWB67_07405 [Caballeronia terrestris]|jgi:hypothetical protein|uniref:Uncharacterized protein n=1 Tax=Caballeronia terrestris TaxID=1226301 RepID=A0A158L307_9BURK|nr:hypothetical protein AWB67_07405 [Caballeronia terrestris]